MTCFHTTLTAFPWEMMTSKKQKTLPRILGSAEDMQYVCNYENKSNEVLNDETSAIVTPTGDSRNGKTNSELLQLEEKSNRPALKTTS